MRPIVFFAFCVAAPSVLFADPVGEFEAQTDVGRVGSPGTARYDPAEDVYTIGGSGENMWFDRDEFTFVWRRMSGDVSLAADIEVFSSGPDANAHRKGIIMIRQSLDGDAAYADVALHGDSLTSLQFRDGKGGVTREIRTINAGPKRLRLEKRGDTFYMSAGDGEDTLKPTGSSVALEMGDPFYIGIGVCAHDNSKFEYAKFSNVVFGEPSAEAAAIRSALEIVPIASGDRTCVFASEEQLESPSWTTDGASLIARGDSGFLAFPIKPYAEPKLLGRKSGVAERSGESPYFAKEVDGRFQLFRRPEDELVQIASSDVNHRHPHLSSDGRWLAYIQYKAGADYESREIELDLRVLDLETGESKSVARFLGGVGSFDAPAWSPDSSHLCFVRYQPRL